MRENTVRSNSCVSVESWQEVRTQLFTADEIAESNIRVELIGKLIEARQNKNITQKELEAITGIKQPVIARIETGTSTPKISTMIKLLRPLGYRLAIVPE